MSVCPYKQKFFFNGEKVEAITLVSKLPSNTGKRCKLVQKVYWVISKEDISTSLCASNHLPIRHGKMFF